MTPNVYRAADGWISEDMVIVQILCGWRPTPASDTFARTVLLPAWIRQAPTKEPAR
jgi:hypothetical protein